MPKPGVRRSKSGSGTQTELRDLGRVDEELRAPDQARLLAQVDDLLDEAREDCNTQPLPDAGQTRVVGERLVEGIAQVPVVGQVQAGGPDELSLGADPLDEHDELELADDDRPMLGWPRSAYSPAPTGERTQDGGSLRGGRTGGRRGPGPQVRRCWVRRGGV